MGKYVPMSRPCRALLAQASRSRECVSCGGAIKRDTFFYKVGPLHDPVCFSCAEKYLA